MEEALQYLLRSGLAFDALHFLAGYVNRSGELVGLEQPAVHHLQDPRTREAEILGRLLHGDCIAILVVHPDPRRP